MKTIIVIDPELLDGKLTGVKCQNEPKEGEFVEVVTELYGIPVRVGRVVSVSPDAGWPGHFSYDVVLEQE